MVIHAFSTSPTLTSKELRAAIVRAKRSVSRETTLAYVMIGGALVKRPLATSCALRQHVGHPPVKGWFMVNSYSAVSTGCEFLKVGKTLPGGRAINPLATELPTGSRASEVCTAIGRHNLLVIKFYGIIHAPVVNNFSQ